MESEHNKQEERIDRLEQELEQYKKNTKGNKTTQSIVGFIGSVVFPVLFVVPALLLYFANKKYKQLVKVSAITSVIIIFIAVIGFFALNTDNDTNNTTSLHRPVQDIQQTYTKQNKKIRQAISNGTDPQIYYRQDGTFERSILYDKGIKIANVHYRQDETIDRAIVYYENGTTKLADEYYQKDEILKRVVLYNRNNVKVAEIHYSIVSGVQTTARVDYYLVNKKVRTEHYDNTGSKVIRTETY